MTKQELYVSFNPLEYKKQKANILSAQADILNSVQKLQNIQKLKRQKANLKMELERLLSSILKDLESIQDKIPNPRLPKTLKEKQEPEETSAEIQEQKQHEQNIEQQLQDIQDKLKKLNE